MTQASDEARDNEIHRTSTFWRPNNIFGERDNNRGSIWGKPSESCTCSLPREHSKLLETRLEILYWTSWTSSWASSLETRLGILKRSRDSMIPELERSTGGGMKQL